MASGESRRADVVAFVRERLGDAPIVVYYDRAGRSQTVFDAPYHPEYRFTTRAGRLTPRAPAGFPFG